MKTKYSEFEYSDQLVFSFRLAALGTSCFIHDCLDHPGQVEIFSLTSVKYFSNFHDIFSGQDRERL